MLQLTKNTRRTYPQYCSHLPSVIWVANPLNMIQFVSRLEASLFIRFLPFIAYIFQDRKTYITRNYFALWILTKTLSQQKQKIKLKVCKKKNYDNNNQLQLTIVTLSQCKSKRFTVKLPGKLSNKSHAKEHNI